eukprot:TRINITY_DN1104_c0_g1_i2.p1 TRINITY_DN1104_c0_g1~~TRINITY_DN1104_c0_g1_i2.p1  ORF type:complete len:511 (+),score=168.76 TRINITY_DN1104_c0_g1_i2:226-1533(+)
MTMVDYFFSLPLNHQEPENGKKISVFVREIFLTEKEKDRENLPAVLYLQGGPGFPSPRVQSSSGWVKKILSRCKLFLLDQRGTGLSSPVTSFSLSLLSPEDQAKFLLQFRADSIVRDSELIRKCLLGERKWTVLGQSFGGFCLTSYLSFFPEGVEAAIFTGGLPPVTGQVVDLVYRKTFRHVINHNQSFYLLFPQAVLLVKEIVNYLQKREVELPGGGILTPRRFLSLGLAFGALGGFERIYFMIEKAFEVVEMEGKEEKRINFSFLRAVENEQQYETNPIYAILHEAIYCQEGEASNWSAERVKKEYPEFIIPENPLDSSHPIYFTGEMIFPWMFDDFKQLKPLKEAAEILAKKNDWGKLYDEKKLKENVVPAAAAIYKNDMFVDMELSLETAAKINGAQYILSPLFHSGLSNDGESLLSSLLSLLPPSVVDGK